MLREVFTVFSRAVLDSVGTITQSIGGVFVIVLYVAGVVILYSRRGREGIKVELQDLLNGLPAAVLACLLILGWHLVRVPYKAYHEQHALARSAYVSWKPQSKRRGTRSIPPTRRTTTCKGPYEPSWLTGE
jgi:hypothetical protein